MKNWIALFIAMIAALAVTSLDAYCCDQSRYDRGRWYLGAFGGYNWAYKNGSSTVANLTVPLPHRPLRRYHPGYICGANLGYRWANGFHLEVEGNTRYNKNKIHYKGNHQSWTGLANVLYQFNIFCWPLDLYFGGGLGYAHARQIIKGGTDHHHTATKRSGFAWQFIGGAAVPFSRHWELNLEYRFFQESNKLLRNNSADLGLRYYF